MSTPTVDLNDLRRRILDGGAYTKEELFSAIQALRTNRVEASIKTAAAKTRKASTSTPMTDADLDASLKSLGLDL